MAARELHHLGFVLENRLWEIRSLILFRQRELQDVTVTPDFRDFNTGTFTPELQVALDEIMSIAHRLQASSKHAFKAAVLGPDHSCYDHLPPLYISTSPVPEVKEAKNPLLKFLEKQRMKRCLVGRPPGMMGLQDI